MHTDTVDLERLYEFAKRDHCGLAMKGKSSEGREYGKLAASVAQSIPDLQGFYIWGMYQKTRLWRTLYLGKAGFGKTASLRARITEELKDERPFIWCGKHTGLDDNAIKKIWHQYYSPSESNNAAQNHINRVLKKNGTSHIIWVATPEISNDEVGSIEADLIETLNPSANAQRPTPVSDLQHVTIDVIKLFKREIHKYR